MRVTIVISTLGGGGAERMATIMANHWASKGWRITILTRAFAGRTPSYALHSKVDVVDLEDQRPYPAAMGALVSLPTGLLEDCSPSERDVLPPIHEILRLRAAIVATAPELVISYLDLTNICVLLATRGLGLPVFVSEQCDPHENAIGTGWKSLRRRFYPYASSVVVLTEESRDYFSSFSGVRCKIIPNAVTPEVFSEPDSRPRQADGRTLLAMGRLGHEKGFDLLLCAFALVAKKHPAWTLEIIGEGPVRSYLEDCVQKHGLAGRVRMPGFTRRPFQAMRRADLFVLSSLEEGFGNVLAEAMACGLAAVSFDCPSGPRHIIRDGIDGVLVPARDAHALADALDRLMGDEAERRRLSEKAPEVVERFGVAKVMGMWEELISDCARTVAASQVGA